MNTAQPSPTISPTLAVVYVPGYGGAQVPVFGGVNYTLMQPTSSPAPTGSGQPSMAPSLPPAVAARDKMASYFCGEFHIPACACSLITFCCGYQTSYVFLNIQEKTGMMWRRTATPHARAEAIKSARIQNISAGPSSKHARRP